MKKLSLIAVLIILLVLPGLANKKTANSSEKFRIKPIFYWTSFSPLIIHTTTESEFGFGFTIIGVDISLFEYKDFKFLSFGVGLQAYQRLVEGWHTYNYYGYSRSYYGWGYRFFADVYGKFVPVKWKWAWMSKALKVNTYIEIGITHKKDISVGVTFSGNPFKKTKKNKESVIN